MDYGSLPPAKPGGAASVAGRVALFPVWLVAEYVVRRPVGALVTAVERVRWPDVDDASTIEDEPRLGISPSVRIDLGLRPVVGFDAFWRDALLKRNTLRLHVGTWEVPRVEIVATDSYEIRAGNELSWRGSVDRRDDNPYYGMGPRSPSAPALRYGSARADAHVRYAATLSRAITADGRVSVRSFGYREGACCNDPSVTDAVRTGATVRPPGFGEGYT